MLKPKIATVAPSRDPARTALAEAIASAGLAERDLSLAEAAVERAGRIFAAASADLDDARAALDNARCAAMAKIIAADADTPTTTDSAMREARARLLNAEDALAASRDAVASVEASAADAREALRRARKRVETAARDALASAIEPAIDRVNRLEAELEAGKAALWFLQSNCFYRSPTETSAKLGRMLHPRAHYYYDGHQALGPWHQALAALASDPDAPLPV